MNSAKKKKTFEPVAEFLSLSICCFNENHKVSVNCFVSLIGNVLIFFRIYYSGFNLHVSEVTEFCGVHLHFGFYFEDSKCTCYFVLTGWLKATTEFPFYY